jgi:hypothetical protein
LIPPCLRSPSPALPSQPMLPLKMPFLIHWLNSLYQLTVLLL